MKKTVLIIMLVTLLTKLTGFLRELILANLFGVSGIVDAYLISLTIPVNFFSLIGVGIITSYIPIFNEIKQTKTQDETMKYTNSLVFVILVICTFFVIGIQLIAPFLVKLFAIGFEGDTYYLAVEFTRIFSLSIFFYSIAYIFTGYLQANGKIVFSSLSSMPLNVGFVIAIIMGAFVDIKLLAWGSVLATIFQMIFLQYFSQKYNFMFSLKLGGWNYISKTFKLAIPVIIGTSVTQINVLVDRTLASSIVVGGIAALNYSNRLTLVFQSVIVTSVSSVLYPKLSKAFAEDKKNDFTRNIVEAMSIVSLLLLPITIGIMIFSKEIVSIVYAHGAFNENAINMTSTTLFYYSIGMCAVGLRDVISRVFFAIQDTKTPMINSIIGMTINLILNVVLAKYIGINGLALASSISAFIVTILMLKSLVIKVENFDFNLFAISIIKIIVAATLMGIISKLGYVVLLNLMKPFTALLLSILMGIVSYLVFLFFLNVKEIKNITLLIKNMLIR